MAIISGAAMAHLLCLQHQVHCFTAGALGVNLGLMIIMGSIVGITCSVAGLIYAFWLNRRQAIPLRTTADTNPEEMKEWLNKNTPNYLHF